MSGLFSALIFGLCFGFLINKARLTNMDTIVNQFRFKDFTVLKYMLTTLIVAMPIIYLMQALGVYTISNVPNTYVVGNLVGGLIFGVGMAIGGFCPGTCVAGAGVGRLDYLIPGMMGFIVGGGIYASTYKYVFPKISSIADYGPAVIPDLWHINAWLFIFAFTAFVLGLFTFFRVKEL